MKPGPSDRVSLASGHRPGAGDAPEEDWDALVARHPEGTIFHTRAWARLVVASFPSLADLSAREETVAGPVVFPLFVWSRAGGLVRTRQSSFPFLYGGPIPAALPPEALSALLRRAGDRWASWRVTGNPFAPAETVSDRATETVWRRAGFRRANETTHLLPLPAEEAGYWDGVLTTAKRNDVRRLGRKGVAVEETRAPGDVDAVYRLYRASFSRWGGAPRFEYPPEFYHHLLSLGPDTARLTVARHEGRVVGGAFTLRWNGKAHYLAGYFDHESRALRPNVLIQVESILRAVRDGLRWYDFLPSGGHVSVEEFKESLGGRRTSFPAWTRTGPVHRLLGSVRG